MTSPSLASVTDETTLSMSAFFGLIESLPPADVEWLLQTGHERQVLSGTRLLEEGQSASAIYVVLQGLLDVRIATQSGSPVATVGPGALVGDIAFLTGMAATADVVAAETSLLLELPLGALHDRVQTHTGFGLRFYRALARLNARRLAETTRRLNAELLRSQEPDSGVDGPMGVLLSQIGTFKHAVGALEKALLKRKGELSDELRAETSRVFEELSSELSALLGPQSGLKESTRAELSQRAHIELLPWILLTDVTARMYTKPRGYAGDYLTIQKIYEDRAGGVGHLGPAIDRAFLDQPPAQAVRNRRTLMAKQIEQAYTPDRPVHVTSFACGPAREVFDAFETLGQPSNLTMSLVDVDDQALEFLTEALKDHPRASAMRLFRSNLVYLALGRQKLELPPQDLIYSIGLIDYFGDRFVVKLLDYIHAHLRPGGRVVLGNFHPRNPSRIWMDTVLQWKLIHRDEADMNRLFRASRFGQDCVEILYEDTRVNLFAVGIKSGEPQTDTACAGDGAKRA